ncbi:hypothetical protein Pint_27848 [Pistacia integerrima]|uniref:Uncharacterized protein n=1 Tax=Pistacia integerrima TaxID=434235 RepID=A0ACC0YSP3_9ROSI|nr:hypothetical protein Pint_27848 [Pistacia integerrima]
MSFLLISYGPRNSSWMMRYKLTVSNSRETIGKHYYSCTVNITIICTREGE